MQVVDRLASSGYSYVSPTVDRACKAVPLLGGIKQRIEPYAPPLIHKADACVETVFDALDFHTVALRAALNSAGTKALYMKGVAYTVVEERASALSDVVTSTGSKAQKMIAESVVVVRVHKSSLAIVDTLDELIDRYLPEPESKAGKDDNCDPSRVYLVPRMLYIPFKIPVRMIRITFAKARNGRDVIQVQIELARQLTSDQKAKLQALIVSKTQAITDKVSTSSLAITLRHGREEAFDMLQVALRSLDTGKEAVRVKCYVMCERLHVAETKDWALTTVASLQQATMDRASKIFVIGTQCVHDATSFVFGEDRATGIFTLVGKRLPLVKIGVQSSASTGTLTVSSSREIEQKPEPSIGAAGKVSSPEALSTCSTDTEKHTACLDEHPVVVESQVAEVDKLLQEAAEEQKKLQEAVRLETLKTER